MASYNALENRYKVIEQTGGTTTYSFITDRYSYVHRWHLDSRCIHHTENCRLDTMGTYM
jgi:hypothetical protein